MPGPSSKWRELAAGMVAMCLVMMYVFVVRPIRRETMLELGPDHLAYLVPVATIVAGVTSPLLGLIPPTFAAPVGLGLVCGTELILMLLHLSPLPVLYPNLFLSICNIAHSVTCRSAPTLCWAWAAHAFGSSTKVSQDFAFLSLATNIGGMVGSLVVMGIVESTGKTGLHLSAALAMGGATVLISVLNYHKSEVVITRKEKRRSTWSTTTSRTQSDFSPSSAIAEPPSPAIETGNTFKKEKKNLMRSYFPRLSAIALLLSTDALLTGCVNCVTELQMSIMFASGFPEASTRVAHLAFLDLWGAALTTAVQIGTGGFLSASTEKSSGNGQKRVGRSFHVQSWVTLMTLTAEPVVAALCISLCSFHAHVDVISVTYVLRRIIIFAVAKPVKESLFTLIPIHDLYATKGLIDQVIFRVGDVCGTWYFACIALFISATGEGVEAVTLLLPILLWLPSRVTLARQHRDRWVQAETQKKMS